MALVLPDRVMETSTTTGTGAYALAGAVTGFQSFSAVGNANTCQYAAFGVDSNGNPNGDWEIGLGTYTASGTTLARTTIYASSNSGSAVNWSAGTKRIAVVRAAAGTLVVRQPGGTAGTHELQISHDGTRVTLSNPATNGTWTFTSSGGSSAMRFEATAGFVFDDAGGSSRTFIGSGSNRCASGGFFGFSNNSTTANTTTDCGFTRAAAGVLRLSDSAGGGTVTFCSTPLTPSQITSNQNNYAPGSAMFYRVASDASRDVTGLSISQTNGQVCEFWNVGGNNIVLKHQDANSTAANRFICTGGADITLAPDEVAVLRYDSTTARWRARKI